MNGQTLIQIQQDLLTKAYAAFNARDIDVQIVFKIRLIGVVALLYLKDNFTTSQPIQGQQQNNCDLSYPDFCLKLYQGN
ncbi:MAG: hypothetical protein ACYTXY_23815 [Nostoc sp.]